MHDLKTCNHFQKQLDHLVRLATSEFRAWTVYAWQRAKVLDADPSGLYRGIADALTLEVKRETDRSRIQGLGATHDASGVPRQPDEENRAEVQQPARDGC